MRSNNWNTDSRATRSTFQVKLSDHSSNAVQAAMHSQQDKASHVRDLIEVIMRILVHKRSWVMRVVHEPGKQPGRGGERGPAGASKRLTASYGPELRMQLFPRCQGVGSRDSAAHGSNMGVVQER